MLKFVCHSAFLALSQQVILLCLVVPNAFADTDLLTIALSGDNPVGADPEQVYQGFRRPAINAQGQVAYAGSFAGNVDGIFVGNGAASRTVVREGDSLNSLSAQLASFGEPYINGSGQLAFSATLDGGDVVFSNNTAILKVDGSGTSVHARKGDQAPDADGGINLSGFQELRFNDLGQTVFRSFLAGPGVTSQSNDGVYAHQDGLRKVLREGDIPQGPAPADVGGFLGTPNYNATLNASGSIAFFGSFEVLQGDPLIGTAVFREDYGSLSILARRFDQPPATPDGTVFTNFSPPSINVLGDVAFEAIAGPSTGGLQTGSGLYVHRDGILVPAAIADQAIGLSAELESITEFEASNESTLLSDNGTLLFAGTISANSAEGTVQRRALMTSDANGSRILVSNGDAAPGLPAGYVFDNFFGSPNPLNFSINSRDQVAFTARLTSPNGPDITGLFAQDESGDIQLIVRHGDELDVSDDPEEVDLRTVATILYEGNSGNGDGRRSGFNDRGQVAFSVEFTDGSSGVFVSNRVADPLLLGDYNTDGRVDAADYTVWRDSFGGQAGSLPNDADGGLIGAAHYETWRHHFGRTNLLSQTIGPVPEPTTFSLSLCLAWLTVSFRHKSSDRFTRQCGLGVAA